MHSHHCHHGGTGQILKWSSIATILFVGVEVFAGFKAGSLALLSDAVHNLTDALALLFTWFALLSAVQARQRRQDVRLSPHGGARRVRQRADAGGALGMDFSMKRPAFRAARAGAGDYHAGGGALGLLLNGGIMWDCASPGRTTSMCAAPSCTCWVTRWAQWRSLPARSPSTIRDGSRSTRRCRWPSAG